MSSDSARSSDIAIVGISVLLPGARNLEATRDLLAQGLDLVSAPSEERLRLSTLPHGDYAPIASLPRIDLFDHRFFGISLAEAEFMDPHHRIALQMACEAIEDAGYGLTRMAGTAMGVYLSAPRPDYQRLLTKSDPLELLGNAPSALPGRISYFLDLRGPSVALDAGCASSLLAVHEAARAIRSGDIQLALAGGVSLSILPERASVAETYSGIISSSGKCRPFDAAADGAVAGEGGAIVLLKSAEEAIRDGDDILALLKGSAVNQNGFRSTGLSAPSPAAQAEVIRAAWSEAGVDPPSIGYIEAHGSGTRLGDVVEIQGLKQAFGDLSPHPRIPIGSIKSNVGHLDHAAGIAGLVKALVSVRFGEIYPTLHFDSPNPFADLDRAPVVVATAVETWEDQPRRAGVSSFSLAGTNVHVVIEEAPGVPERGVAGPGVLTISAKSPASLSTYCEKMTSFLQTSEQHPADIARTTNTGRDHHPYRVALLAGGAEHFASAMGRRGLGATRPAPGPAEIVLLFSGDGKLDDRLRQELTQTYRVFRDAHEEFGSSAGQPPMFEIARDHYALYRLFRSLGLCESAVLGSGPGNVAVRVIRDGIPPAEAVSVLDGTAETQAIDIEKLSEAIATLEAENPVFVEMAPSGTLSSEIERFGGPGVLAVVSFVRRSAEDVLHAVAFVYEHGADVDWTIHHSSAPPDRVRIPTYPFEEIRAWCRQPGNIYDPGAAPVSQHATEPDALEGIPIGELESKSEQRLAVIWRDALKVAIPGPSANYFDLGGTSITGLTVLDEVEREFGVQISFQDLYENATLAGLAAHIVDLAARREAIEDVSITVVAREDVMPVSIGQEQIWFMDQINPGSPLYNIPFDIRLQGRLDVPALRNAIEGLIHRHEVLRSSFVEIDGRAWARISEPAELSLEVVDLSADPRSRAEAIRLFDEEASTPFDLATPPLVRSKLLKLSDSEHVLLMTFHHIVYDGWTPAILHTELSELYRAQLEGRAPELADLPIQYADYAAWQREYLSGERLEQGLEYWISHLKGAPNLDLPFDRPRSSVQSYRGGLLQFEVGEHVAESLRKLSRNEGVTLFTTMMSALSTLLFRYSGQDDVVIGSASTGRRRPETRGLIGYFNNVLPFRANLSGDPTFIELMHRMVRVVSQGLDNEEVPFEKIVEVLQPKRDLSRNPIFQVAYTHQNTPHEDYSLPGLETATFAEGTVRGIAPGTSKFDITIGIGDQGGGALEGYFEYARDLFDDSTAERMVSHFLALLASVAAGPTARLSELELMDDEERRLVTRSWNATQQVSPRRTLPELMAGLAAENPAGDAVVEGDRRISFEQLELNASQLACRLLENDVQGRVIALVLPRCIEWVVAQLAAGKASAAFASVDPAFPADRIRFIIEDCDAAVIVTSREQADRIGDPDRPLILVDDDTGPPPVSASVTETGPAPEDPAYVLYTSGSTGNPKGVVISHDSLVNLIQWHVARFEVTPSARASHVAGLSFDASIWELWANLGGGAAVHLGAEGILRDIDLLLAWLEREQITHAFIPTALAETIWSEPQYRPRLRPDYLFIGGEALHRRPPEGLGFEVYNMYGPTETAVIASCSRVDPGAARPDIGSPISNVNIYVVEPSGRPAPIGVPGEIWIAGRGVGLGYANLPGLTRTRFVDDPFKSGGRLYKTGDIGRWLPSGKIEFLGRRDLQVKIRGFRVELEEVESLMLGTPGVVAAAAVVREDRPGIKQIVAYFSGTTPEDQVDEVLRRKLPDYMVPAMILKLDQLPLNASGKIDRSSLPTPGFAQPSEGEPFQNETELALASIWSRVLGIERIAPNDNFFELGGDSILSIQIVARARAENIRITPKDVFKHQTVRDLAAAATAVTMLEDAGPAVSGDVPLGPIQRWFFDRVSGAPGHFNLAEVFELDARIQPEHVVTALRAVIAHHDQLRARFEHAGEGWKQVVDEAGQTGAHRLVDLSAVEEAIRAQQVEEECERVQRSLDLERGPLIKTVHFLLGTSRPSLLLVAVHHLVCDVVSWSVISSDLDSLLGTLSEGREVTLPPRTTSFKKWVEDLQSLARGARLDAFPQDARSLRPDFELGPNSEESAVTESLEFDEATTRSVWRGGPEHLVLAALATAILQTFEVDGITVDVERHGRESLHEEWDLSRTVGWFTNLLPVDISGASAKDVLALIRDGLAGDLARASVARHLDDRYRLEQLGRPQPSIGFNFLGRTGETAGAVLKPSILSPGTLRDPSSLRPHMLDAEFVIREGKLRCGITYSENLHARKTIARLMNSFRRALFGLSNDNDPSPRIPDPIRRRYSGIEDALVLTPLQQGLLFHTLKDATSGVYFEQMQLVLRGPVDSDLLVESWTQLVRRHQVLRSAVAWEGLDQPHLVVLDNVEMPAATFDYRGMREEEQDRRLRELLAEDAARGFDMQRAPLHRLSIVQLADDAVRVIWSHHHILLDGWSLQVLMGELFVIYEARQSGRPQDLPDPVPFSRLTDWLASQDTAEARKYFEALLDGFDTPTRLNAPSPREGGSGHAMVTLDADPQTLSSLEGFGRRTRVTINSIVQGALAVLLSMYSASDDVVYGATVSGRPADLDGVESLVGLAINTLPVRVRVPSMGVTVGEWLRSIQAGQADQRAYEYISLADVQKWSQLPAGTPLFDAILVYENYPVDEVWDRGPFEIEGEPLVEQTNYPITFVVAPGERLLIRISFDRERYDESTARTIGEQFLEAIEEIARDPDRSVDALPLPGAVIVDPDHGRREPPEALLTGMFAQQVQRTPYAPALLVGKKEISYQELDEHSNAIARSLRDRGVGSEDLVGVFLDRDVLLVPALLGILKAHAAYVPLDPAYPEARLRLIMQDTEMRFVLTSRSLAQMLPGLGALMINVEDIAETQGSEVDLGEPDPRSLAYVLYTSGSTGTPKGVALEHGGVAAFLHWATEAFARRLSSVGATTSINFDLSVFELFAPLVSGGRVVLLRDALALAELESEADVGLINTVPSALNELIESAQIPSTVRYVNLAGEPLPGALVDKIYSRTNVERVFNLYGPSEDTTYSTFDEVEPGTSNPTIGRGTGGTRVRLLDRRMRPVPAGVAGEIYLGGPGLARGYLNRPHLTAERFVPDPFSSLGERLYRTGDLARYLPDGRLEFLGRADLQVKIRGYRIELGEIEANLESLPSVEQAVVLAREDSASSKDLVAYVRSSSELDTSTLRRHLSSNLPGYMVPSTYVVLETFPVLPNGKVDRQMLPAPIQGRELTNEFIAPETATQELVAMMWSNVLGVEKVGQEDDFFELGGHSLIATRLVSRLNEAFRATVPLGTVFERPTVRDQAEAIGEIWGGSKISDEVARTVLEILTMPDQDVRKLLEEDGR